MNTDNTTTTVSTTAPTTAKPGLLNATYRTYVATAVTILIYAAEQINQSTADRQESLARIRLDVTSMQQQIARIEQKLDDEHAATAPGASTGESLTLGNR